MIGCLDDKSFSPANATRMQPGVFRLGLVAFVVSCFYAVPALAGTSLPEALTEGDVDLTLRLRHENVDDDTPGISEAHAHTLRTVLRYQTAPWYGLGAELEFEDVRALGEERFNSTVNGKTGRAVVADPEGAEINQANLWYRGPARTELRVGREVITYREAPFHRFIGPVVWRQNWQSFDAVTLTNRAFPETVLSYAHIFNVNTIFGEDSLQSDIEMNTDLFNVQYGGLPFAKVEGYAYLIDNEDNPSVSNRTLGGRIHGSWPGEGTPQILYTAEYANQGDYRGGAERNDADYWLGEIGVKGPRFKLKGSYELLGGDGAFGFQTPLATKHAFQGWADQFLITPRDGILDRYVTGVLRFWPVTFTAVYHDFEADNADYAFGEELDLRGTVAVGEHLTLALKYADYNADRNSTNLARNPGLPLTRDVTKFWAYATARF